MFSLNEDNYDEINKVLRELDVASRSELPDTRRILIASGEDCQYVMFGGNYKTISSGASDGD